MPRRPRQMHNKFAKSAAKFYDPCRAEEIPTKQEKGYRILKIKGDGRCMFRALVDLFPGQVLACNWAQAAL